MCFIIVCNEEVRELNQLLFNDSILALYVVLCLYFITCNRPHIAALMLSLALSIKAGAILLLPGLLGWTHYMYGTKKLIMSIFIIVFLQLLMVAPFIFNPVAWLLGFKKGAQTDI